MTFKECVLFLNGRVQQVKIIGRKKLLSHFMYLLLLWN